MWQCSKLKAETLTPFICFLGYTRLFIQLSPAHELKGNVSGMIAVCVVILNVEPSGAGKKNSSKNPRQKPANIEVGVFSRADVMLLVSALSREARESIGSTYHLEGTPVMHTTWSSWKSKIVLGKQV